MRSVLLGVVSLEERSACLPVLDRTRRLSESATSAMAILSLRCLFFTKPPPIKTDDSSAARRTPVQKARPTPVPKDRQAKFRQQFGFTGSLELVQSAVCAALGRGFPEMANPGLRRSEEIAESAARPMLMPLLRETWFAEKKRASREDAR